MKRSTLFLTVAAPLLGSIQATTLRAGSVNIALSVVGNPGNAPDTTVMVTDTTSGYGRVDYAYRIGTYDVTLSQYAEFLNAVARNDQYGLYDSRLGSGDHIKGIMQSGTSGNYSYSVIGNGQNPVTFVTWLDAARFCNWLQNGQPETGAETAETTETGAYTLNGDTSGGLETRNAGATWWIPSEDEWYKAAYYDPMLNGTGGYWLYPTQSNTAPGNVVGRGTNEANYDNGVYSVTQSAMESATQNYLTAVGSFANSAGYYGTFDQGGDVYQWNEAVKGFSHGVRGGQWGFAANDLQSSDRETRLATNGNDGVGFRVATGPGNYTLLLSKTGTNAGVPQGTGYATLTVRKSGGVIMAGKLPDNESFSISGSLASGTAGIQFIIDRPLSYPSVTSRGAQGSLVGTLTFATQTGTSDLSGTLEWIKPEQRTGAYPAAINANLAVIGSSYTVQRKGSVLPGFTSGTLELSDTGALSVSGTTPLDQGVTLTSANAFKLIDPVEDKLTVAITASTGVFNGSFVYPGQKMRTHLCGVLFQDQTIGAGFFISPAGSGPVSLGATTVAHGAQPDEH